MNDRRTAADTMAAIRLYDCVNAARFRMPETVN
jgi:hypothetical protein